MKPCQIVFFLVLLAALSSRSPAQTYGWVDWSARIPEQVGFTDVHFVGNEGWVTGGNSRLYHTTDGGETFTTQNLPANSGITNSIFMRSVTEGYLVTSMGKVFRSTDAGNGNWTAILPGASVALYSIHFPPLPDSAGYACGNAGRVYQITPTSVRLDWTLGGATFYSIVFPTNSNLGWVCGSVNVWHRDSIWRSDQFIETGTGKNAIFFADTRNGWVVGSGGGPPDRGIINHTSDGRNWNGQFNPDTVPSRILNDVYFMNSREGWSVGTFGLILHTTDGGRMPDGHWQVEGQSAASGRLLRAVHAVDNHAVYVVGNNTFLKYTQVTDVDGEQDLPASFVLHQNYPNPFNPTTSFEFSVPSGRDLAGGGKVPSCDGSTSLTTRLVTLKVYDVLGVCPSNSVSS